MGLTKSRLKDPQNIRLIKVKRRIMDITNQINKGSLRSCIPSSEDSPFTQAHEGFYATFS